MWQLEISREAGLDLSKLDGPTQACIMTDLHGYVMPLVEQHGKPRRKVNIRFTLWPFRSGRCRILCKIFYEKRTVLIMEIRKRF